MNFLNLPYRTNNTDDEDGNPILTNYLSDGTKIRAFNDGQCKGYAYLGSLVYSDYDGELTLESASHPEGRFVVSSNGIATHYFITDHLGSVRLIADSDIHFIEEKDYYPFGLELTRSDLRTSNNRYRYNGKEQLTGL